MKNLKLLFVILIILPLISCATAPQKPTASEETHRPAKFRMDDVIAAFPSFRIDNKMNRIAIIGSGKGSNDINASLTRLFVEGKPLIKVIEPGNLQAVLGGKVIEFGTGLNPSDAQMLSQMLQIDHLLLFDEQVPPHKDYKYGGRVYVKISLKIVNILTGEVIYQDIVNFGVTYERPATGRELTETTSSDFDVLRSRCLWMINHRLAYAIGDYNFGFRFGSGDITISKIMKNSISEEAGLQVGDKIVEINGFRVQSPSDYERSIKPLRQGDGVKLKVERQGKVMEFNIKISKIPFRPEEEKKEKSIKTPV